VPWQGTRPDAIAAKFGISGVLKVTVKGGSHGQFDLVRSAAPGKKKVSNAEAKWLLQRCARGID
jgi:hypothetical protein